jgi:hypothetical protein
MLKALVFLVFSTFIIINRIHAQDTTSFRKLPIASQIAIKQIVNKYRTGAVSRSMVESDLKRSPIDVENMPLDDLINLVMMLVAEDARKDLKEQAEEMKNFLKEKKAMRDELSLRNERDSVRNRMMREFQLDSSRRASRIKFIEMRIKSIDEASKPQIPGRTRQ